MKYFLIFIIILALVLRIYQLDLVPPSLSWDEAAVGYNAWSIANYGKDENGKFYPLYFRSFGDDKHPVHIYLTVISVKLLGLNEFSTRLPSALFGTLNVILIFFLAKILFEKELIGLSAAFLLAISPQNIHFSRFNHEANFVLFFLMMALTLFFYFIKKDKKLLSLATLSFAICFIAYHPAKVVVPILALLLTMFYWKKIIKDKAEVAISLVIVVFFSILIFLNPQLLGIARINQTSQGLESIKETTLYQQTNNKLLGRLNLIATQYSWHFLPQYLFISGDKNPRLSFQVAGEFYKIDAIFLILGTGYLLYKRSKEGLIVLAWALIGPLPSALVAEAPHAARSSLMMGSWNIITALGFYILVKLWKSNILKFIILALVTLIYVYFLYINLKYYFGEYPKRYAIEWQYGMKQIVEYVKEHSEYEYIYTTDVRSQPYIFFLYYLNNPLPDYLKSVSYNNSKSNKSYNTVVSFERYNFGNWDPIESFPNKGILYVITPSQYDGLRHKLLFDVKKVIYYPNGSAAFYLVSAK